MSCSRIKSIALLIMLLNGCVTATISEPATPVRDAIPPELSAEYPTVVVEGQDTPQQVGSLFALLALPVGSIVVTKPRELIEDSVMRTIITTTKRRHIDGLRITDTNFQMTAYDLLVTRRIVCSITGTIEAFYTAGDPTIQTIPIEISLSRYRSLAFSPQITEVARECVREFANEAIRTITARVHIGHQP